MNERALREALGRALARVDLRGAVRGALERAPRPRSVDVLAIGKGAATMIEGALDVWGDRLGAALVVLPEGAAAPPIDARVRVVRGSHPLPDERSVIAGEDVLAFARGSQADVLAVLVSGGASALAFVPAEGIELGDAWALFDALLRSGADVRAINVVRRHVSRVAGGGIVRVAAPRAVQAWIASDVLGGSPHDVGSGPASVDPTTVEDAQAVLARFAPSFGALPLVESLKAPHAEGKSLESQVVSSPGDLAAAFAFELGEAGLEVRLLEPTLDEAGRVAEEYGRLGPALEPGCALVRSAESGLVVSRGASGEGGRCSHLAALMALRLPEGVAFVAAASDGVDGGSRTAGAIVTRGSLGEDANVSAALAAFDTGPLHRARGTALPQGPTGVNLADLHALVRA